MRIEILKKQSQFRKNSGGGANVPFYGTYEKEAEVAQQAGRTVPPPEVQ